MLNPHDTVPMMYPCCQSTPKRHSWFLIIRMFEQLNSLIIIYIGILGTCFRFWFFSHWTMHLNSSAKELRHRWGQTAAKVGHLVAPGKLWFGEVRPDQIYVLQNTGKPWKAMGKPFFHRPFGGEDFVLGVSRLFSFVDITTSDIWYMFQIVPHSSTCQFGCAPCMRVSWQVELFSVHTHRSPSAGPPRTIYAFWGPPTPLLPWKTRHRPHHSQSHFWYHSLLLVLQ